MRIKTRESLHAEWVAMCEALRDTGPFTACKGVEGGLGAERSEADAEAFTKEYLDSTAGKNGPGLFMVKALVGAGQMIQAASRGQVVNLPEITSAILYAFFTSRQIVADNGGCPCPTCAAGKQTH